MIIMAPKQVPIMARYSHLAAKGLLRREKKRLAGRGPRGVRSTPISALRPVQGGDTARD